VRRGEQKNVIKHLEVNKFEYSPGIWKRFQDKKPKFFLIFLM
jgi:hypothetical protein